MSQLDTAPRRDALTVDRRRAAIVVNPVKVADVGDTQRTIARILRDRGWQEPQFFLTDRADSGVAATRAALASDPDVVCVVGGDGTVRAVASVLRGTAVPLALVPGGTGNLLARNLGVPLDSWEEAFDVAVSGQNRAIDVGLATFDDGIEHVYVVMSGIGLDAEIMAQTDERLKKRMGWGAYVVAGGARMFREGFTATLTADGVTQPSRSSLMVLACNCSSVVGGIDVATGALLDDGRMDLVMLQPRAVIGWMGVAFDVAAKTRNGIASIGQWGGRDFGVELDRPVLAEVDGDPVGLTRSGRFRVDPLALIVRLPVPVKRHTLLGVTQW